MRQKRRGIESLKSRYGMLFTAHWVFGLIIFFIYPIILSLIISFSDARIVSGGVDISFAGFKQYKYLLFEEAQYTTNLRNDIIRLFYTVPIIVAISLVQATVLNGKFRGRLFARTMFFLPAIIATGTVMTILKTGVVKCPIFIAQVAEEQTNYGSAIDFSALLQSLSLPVSMTTMFEEWFSNLFLLLWSCGVQTILFISGLQTISPALYEVAKVEGANKWEEFWFITLPMLGNVLLLVIIYTLIEYFISVDNSVMSQAISVMNESQIYDRSSAMMWFYLLIAGVIIGTVIFLYNRFCLKRWN